MTANNVAHLLDGLFATCFTIDANLQVSNPTSTLKSYCPGIEPGKSLLDLFEVQRPVLVHGKIILKEHLNSLFLLVAKRSFYRAPGSGCAVGRWQVVPICRRTLACLDVRV